MKQTAVEWLYEMLRDNSKELFDGNIWEQAKAMEKEQIKDAWRCGDNNTGTMISDRYAISDESFYNQTYGGDK